MSLADYQREVEYIESMTREHNKRKEDPHERSINKGIAADGEGSSVGK
jgi:hypothetical protein